ncbi:MAG: hypothetical protein HZY76_23300 [Anaerolineae bacterium]|nr:MAG: hypothetical protein HZY76_23300 [Anaerolineae bacterium]
MHARRARRRLLLVHRQPHRQSPALDHPTDQPGRAGRRRPRLPRVRQTPLPTPRSDWGRYRLFERALPPAARKPVVITEAGIDDIGNPQASGWIAQGLTARLYRSAGQLRYTARGG